MKIVASFLVVGAIIGLMIYASGGFDAFVQNLLSARSPSSSTEEIDLDSRERNTAEMNAAFAMSAKKSSVKKGVVSAKRCSASSSAIEAGEVLLNEVAWMGSEGDSKREWIELKNNSSSTISLAGWELLDKSGKIDVRFGKRDIIPSNGFQIVSRGKEFTGTINNSDEALYLFDANCGLTDMVVANPKWPAGDVKKGMTAERSPDLSWHTSQLIGGTPKRENSIVMSVMRQGANDATAQTSGSASFFAIRISEVMTGATNNPDFEFVELYNTSSSSISLTGLSLKKRSLRGAESTLVSESRLNGKTLPAHSYLLLANEKGYTGDVHADVAWPSSYSLSGSKNGIVVYDARNAVIDSVRWDSIPDGSSMVRDGWESSLFHLTSFPTPQHMGTR